MAVGVLRRLLTRLAVLLGAGVAAWAYFLGDQTAGGASVAAEAPAPAGRGMVIWAGDGESGLADEWATGNAYDINAGRGTFTHRRSWAGTTRVRRVRRPRAQGTAAYALTVRARDRDPYTRGAQRTELGQNNPDRRMPDRVDRQMYQGQDRWIALQLRIPRSFPKARWNTLVQLKGAGTGNGPFGLALAGGRLILQKSATQKPGSTSLRRVWAQLRHTARDHWIKLLMHVRWSTGADGSYAVFGDLADGRGFRRLRATTRDWTLKYDRDGHPAAVGARFGIYRAAVRRDATVYFDGFNVATTRAGATLRAFGTTL
jgi:hypothetical protein